MDYTVVIRTLGTAGDKYRQLLESLNKQTIQPSKILVYIAKGYAIPKETIGREQYIYVKKGMVAQRALTYDDVDTEYILFLDDDVYLPETAVAQLYQYLVDNDADVISPDVFPNSERSTVSKWMMKLSGRMVDRWDDGKWGYKVTCNSGYSYNANPKQGVYLSQTNAGPCFFCKKEDFLKIHFEEELWMDQVKYALGDDQVMFYKMYCIGLKQLTSFHSGIKHLDAGTTMMSEEKEKMLIYSDFRFKTIFWHRFIYLPDTCLWSRIGSMIAISYTFLFTLLISLVKGRMDIFKLKVKAVKDALHFMASEEYRALPLIKKVV